MEKVNSYERKKDYSYLKEKYKRNINYSRKQKDDFNITMSEKIGLQIVICALVLVVLVVGKLFELESITKFENIIERTVSEDSSFYAENVTLKKILEDTKVKLGLDNENTAIPASTINDEVEELNNEVILDEEILETYEDTIIEKKP